MASSLSSTLSWVGAYAALGALAVASTTGCAVTTEGASTTQSALSEDCASPTFLAIKRAASAVASHGSFDASVQNRASKTVVHEGTEIFATMADLIAGAEQEVNLQTWRWDPGAGPEIAILEGIRRLAERLASEGKRAKPVEVRLLLNVIPSSDSHLFEKLSASLEAMRLDSTRLHVTVARFAANLLGANHVKGLVVDGSKVFVSGANMSSDFYEEGNRYWDVGYRFDGAVARGLRKDFAVAWSKGDEWRCGSRGLSTDAESRDRCDRDRDFPWASLGALPAVDTSASDAAVADLCSPILVVGHESHALPFPTSDNDTPQAQAFLAAVGSATRVIRLQTPNLNEPAMVDAIVAAVRRGVEVDLLLSKGHEQSGESLPGRGGPNDAIVKKMMDTLGASACKGLVVRWFSRDGRAPVESKGAPSSHVKFLSIDDQVTIMGSANQDVQSWRNSREVNVVVDGADLATTYRDAVFAPVWARAIDAATTCR
ncbi:MAG: cardiolipin synthase [Myxococcales bacterium]|jgi:phosphatidylserine/phosphatidylglycerophosphate/cardiolipin synthase-like enzyme|nr:cardiolipin synthase [Myxococcales bacterium]